MITCESILINDINDYKKLLEYIDDQYIDEYLIQKISEHIGSQCKKILIEYPYYESDYLSSYYIFYVKKLQKFPKECYRILFYKDRKAQTLMGYITLRPTYEGRRLGKIFFDPHYLVREKSYLILGDCKCHMGGTESVIQIFPHMKQEGDVAVCAHVATWSVLRSFANRFHRYPEMTIGKIVEMASPQSERMIPSHGLTAYQISQIFLDAGFSPVVLLKDEKEPRLIKDALISYISSGIPVVAVLTSRSHAISVVGIGDYLLTDSDIGELIKVTHPFESYLEDGNEVTTNVILSSRFYNSILVNDDNFFPYSTVYMKRPASFRENLDKIPYMIPEIDRLIIPLYPRIQLTYEDVRTFFLRLVSTNSDKWKGPTVGRIFLASANTYREYINEECQMLSHTIRQILISLEMPRFIWCVETSTPEHFRSDEPCVDGLVILDSTSATINAEPFLFIAFPNGVVRFKSNSFIYEYVDENRRGLSMPRFNRNLVEVN